MSKGQGPPPQYPQAPPPGFTNPPAYSAVAPQQQAPTVVIVQGAAFGPEPQRLNCPHCHASITTRIDVAPTGMTHLAFLLCCLFGCFCCAPCIYCVDDFQAKKHYCPKCNRYLGQDGCN